MSETCCDLKAMTKEELECLRTRCSEVISERETAENEDFLSSDEFKALKKDWKLLKKEAKALAKKREFDLTIPLKFKIGIDLNDLNYLMSSGYSMDVTDVFNIESSAKVVGGDFDKEMLSNVQGVVDQATEDLCSDVLHLCPELGKSVDDFIERLQEFHSRLEDSPVCFTDIE